MKKIKKKTFKTNPTKKSKETIKKTQKLSKIVMPFQILKALHHSDIVYLADPGEARGCSKNSLVIN